jgi:putative phage-type endonuclease
MEVRTIEIPIKSEAQWYEERKKGIGASEAPQALGLVPYEGSSPLDLYLRKIGRLPPVVENEPMELGKLLEDDIAELYRRRTGRALVRQQVFLRAVDLPLFGTIDGFDSEGDLVEIKTIGAFSADRLGEDGSDEIPSAWIVQAHQQMLLSGRPRAKFAVLVGGQRFRHFEVTRNERLIDAIVPDLVEFWRCVERRTMPRMPHELTPALLAAINPDCHGDLVLDGDVCELVERYESLGNSKSAIEAEREALKVMILRVMGTARFGALPDGRRVKRYLQKQPEKIVVHKAHTKHYFSIVKGDDE